MSQPRSDSRKFHCTHQCPGRCGRSVANHLYACGRCWRKLPAQLQQAIRTTVGQPVLSPARTRAFTAAARYRERLRWRRTVASTIVPTVKTSAPIRQGVTSSAFMAAR